MQAEFWLASKYGVTLSREHVCEAMKIKPQTLSNLMARGEFPRPMPGGSWAVQTVGKWIDDRAAEGEREAAA